MPRPLTRQLPAITPAGQTGYAASIGLSAGIIQAASGTTTKPSSAKRSRQHRELVGQSGAQLTGTDHDGNALVADGMKVGAAVLLDERFTAAGTVSLNSARADQLVLSPAKPAGANEMTFNFTATGAQIARVLRWAPDGQFSGHVNLEDAHVGELEDNWTPTGEQAYGYWPLDGRLHLWRAR